MIHVHTHQQQAATCGAFDEFFLRGIGHGLRFKSCALILHLDAHPAAINPTVDLLEKEVVPLYYQRNGHGYSEGWVKLSKASMKSIMPRFNSQRMVMDYVSRYYAPANQRCKVLSANNGAAATQLSEWKKKVAQAWPEVRINRIDTIIQEIKTGECLPIRATAFLGGLTPDDVCVECLLGTTSDTGEFTVHERHILLSTQRGSGGEITTNWTYELDLCPVLSGLQHYKLRIYPCHKLLSHPLETGWMVWF